MVHWLNKKYILLFLSLLFVGSIFSQEDGVSPPVYKDYKDPEQFEKFYKRRKIVGAWQINELKKGALVVRLKTEKLLIEALLKAGNTSMAEKKRLERLAINLNIMKAYRTYYNFSKVYFIYTSSNDSLLNGLRSRIFLDSNLVPDPNIAMTEDFYLIAETDFVYNSSIGFVKEDSARFVSENGSTINREAPIVVKNKYGHQLKKPFPYWTDKIPIRKAIFTEVVTINGVPIVFNVSGVIGAKKMATYTYEGEPLKLSIPYLFTYSLFSYFVTILNNNFQEYYRENPKPDLEKIGNIKPFLY